MSVFDLFRGFFGVPGGRNRGGDQREPFFEWLTHEDDDDDDDEVEDGFHHEYFDDGLRFDFSFGPNRMRIQQPQLFEQIFQEMEDMFASLGSFRHAPRDVCPSSPGGPSAPRSPFHHWTPFSRFRDVWSDGTRPKEEEKKVDGDLDSQVSSGGLEHILTPAPSQPNTRSSFKSVTVMKVVKPDGTVEERRTVRDGLGNEETTVIRSGPGAQEGPHDDASPSAGAPEPFSDMQDDFSIFSKFFGGFRR
ncbi:HCLS1-associated protein X-1 isoform X2 [Tachysurus fulvidraco]|uniref:HCLS1-associated protein X-1 isoform X2 n=1 Tax=Tachysurus fulvidraco TaxID=1234273 RepID=UPI000F4DE84F|nr:HCLS1-associated protein X-1 isoform X2 [Tachysurus fulvidraco]